MEMLLAGLAGVVLGALIASAIILHVFQKRADRDLIERRLRACSEYRECLGDLEAVFAGSEANAQVLEQAWRNVAMFCREFRLTSWLLRPEVRTRLTRVVDDLEREGRAQGTNGAGAGGRAAQHLCEAWQEVDAILRREMSRELREHRRLRFLPGHPFHENGADEELRERGPAQENVP